MDREQEKMQFLGLFGIYQESFKIILPWRKIFSQITFALILPLISFIFLIYKQVSDVLFEEIQQDSNEHLSPTFSSDWDTFVFFSLICASFILVFSILSTSAVVYTVASIYTAGKVSFVKVMSIVPKVSKRLMVTLLCTVLDFLAYSFWHLLAMWGLTTVVRKYCGKDSLVASSVTMMIFYLAGLVREIVVWKLASVVTLLEDSCGFEAMRKSKELVKENLRLSTFIFVSVNVPFFVTQILFMMVVLGQWELLRLGYVGKTALGIVCFLVSCHMMLIELVVQTLLYFVCKSHHSENIDRDALLDLLEICRGDQCELLKAKDVQKEQDHVCIFA